MAGANPPIRPYTSERVTRGKVERSIYRTIGAISRITPSNSVLAVLAVPFWQHPLLDMMNSRSFDHYQTCKGMRSLDNL